MTQDQFDKGLTNIANALTASLRDRRVEGAVVGHTLAGPAPADARFTVTVGGKCEAQSFAREEIEDSGEAIDAPVAIKVRMLVSPFVR